METKFNVESLFLNYLIQYTYIEKKNILQYNVQILNYYMYLLPFALNNYKSKQYNSNNNTSILAKLENNVPTQ